MDGKDKENKEVGNPEKIELKWWEKRQGICLYQKKVQAKAEQQKKEKREQKKKLAEQKKAEGDAAAKKAEKTARPRREPSKKRNPPVVRSLDSLYNIDSVPQDAKEIIADFMDVVADSHPLNSRQRALLPKHIRVLSHYLTDERKDRWLGYMNETTSLSAYVHYYLWWNLVRLTRLFSNLPKDFLKLSQDDVCLDIGSGPLTVPIALFLARPELRSVRLKWYCMDISSQALQFGMDIFLSVAARLKCEAWEIVRVKGEFGDRIKQDASFVTCANMFNEANENTDMPPEYTAKKFAEKLLAYTDKANHSAKFLIIEPGVPKSGRFISLLRDAFIRKDFVPLSPCTHCAECPMNGEDKSKGGKWCNYVFTTEDAPKVLLKLSDQSNLTKERAVLSFVALACAGEAKAESGEKKKDSLHKEEFLSFRIASDPIRLPGERTGYYACSSEGLLLVVTQTALHSGESYSVRMPKYQMRTDWKSGAFILNLD
ncbi:MAG: hypothetical protein K6E22_03025 [Treponema sp.]|nr:hypothetical protein [Treponema sp.]